MDGMWSEYIVGVMPYSIDCTKRMCYMNRNVYFNVDDSPTFLKEISMKRDIFRILFTLTNKQPWLIDNPTNLEHLLFEECENDAARELLIDLVNRFEFIDNERYQELMRQIALEIVTEPGIYEQSTLISAMSIGHDADSGQAIIYSLKALLQEQHWTKHKAINDAMQACKTFKRNAQLRNIILVDEFVGSGKTVIERVETIHRQFREANLDDVTVTVKVLAGTEEGIKRIKSKKIDITSQITISRGITDFYKENRSEKIKLMIELESILSKEYNGKPMPSMGYGEAEALYYRKDINLPNSVFPIFWWAEYKNKKNRPTLLVRSMGDA
ncbi:hypothetical protein I5P68_19530 [Serratia ureilytica]|uniref:phosphoribosyltransferase-like protein n=2 Tax=Serratia ureilytica TaxID=300181 RepID=UPI0018D607C8|nr:hypothetical protein [Serratia ureilytica]MBH2721948.1 hypothetical protein [Serratia ureilytica]